MKNFERRMAERATAETMQDVATEMSKALGANVLTIGVLEREIPVERPVWVPQDVDILRCFATSKLNATFCVVGAPGDTEYEIAIREITRGLQVHPNNPTHTFKCKDKAEAMQAQGDIVWEFVTLLANNPLTQEGYDKWVAACLAMNEANE